MQRVTYRARIAAFSVIILALLTAMLASTSAAQKDKPLNQEEIIELLQAHVASAHVGEIVDERGIDFNFTPAIERKVRNAGGGDDVVAALNRASQRYAESQAPRTGELVVKTTPGEAQVYLNDEPKGMTSPEGEIRLPDMQPGRYNLRVSLPGYQSFEKGITIETGEPQTVYVTLVQKSDVTSPKPNPVSPQPASEGIPIPGVKVSGFQFLESAFESIPDKANRVYAYTFSRATTRTIYWELDLKFPPPGRRIDFQVNAIWYNPEGSEMARQNYSGHVDPTWPDSYHTFGRGWKDAGHWTPGTYRVDLYCQNTRIATGTFSIN